MAFVVMDSLEIGKQYTAIQLSKIWGYESHHALVKGIITPKNHNIVCNERKAVWSNTI